MKFYRNGGDYDFVILLIFFCTCTACDESNKAKNESISNHHTILTIEDRMDKLEKEIKVLKEEK